MKTFKKRICIPLYKVKNRTCIEHKEMFHLSNITIVQMKERASFNIVDFSKLKIIEIKKKKV